jgi:hypothetical protein
MFYTAHRTFKFIAIASYLLIILMGSMIGLPFFLWLMFNFFNFGDLAQLFAFLAITSITVNIIYCRSPRTMKTILLDIACFVLLASPLIWRMSVVPIKLFNYLAFIIPAGIFVLFYFLSIIFSTIIYMRTKKSGSKIIRPAASHIMENN